MKTLKSLFATPKKAIFVSLCIVILLALVGTAAAFTVEAIAEKSAIGSAAAESIAYGDLGLIEEQVQKKRTEFDFENGMFLYDVAFTVDGAAYEYHIRASDGTVMEKEEKADPASIGTAASGENLTEDAAKKAALADAGVAAADATFTKTELDRDDGVLIYDVEFYTADASYEYEILASTGAVLQKDQKLRVAPTPGTQPVDTTAGATLSKDAAKAAALADAGVAAADATFAKAELDRDDGIRIYDIEFYTADASYEYEIHASTGAVLQKDQKLRVVPTPGTQPVDTTAAATVSKDAAKAAALADAGVAAADATFTKTELDRDDGVLVYDIEFYTADASYEYEIHASTGAVHQKAIERHTQQTGSPDTPSTYIGVDAAKARALKHANVSASTVSFHKAKLENDDGWFVYEIEFYTAMYEYDYTVDAVSGAIIEYDIEPMDD